MRSSMGTLVVIIVLLVLLLISTWSRRGLRRGPLLKWYLPLAAPSIETCYSLIRLLKLQ